MDMMAMVSSMLAMQASSTQMQVAASFMKQNADAEKSAVMTLLGAGPNSPPTSAPASAAISTFQPKISSCHSGARVARTRNSIGSIVPRAPE